MEQVFTNKDHGNNIMKALSKLWKEKRYCDAVLEVGPEKLEFHRLVLKACSPLVVDSTATRGGGQRLTLNVKGIDEDTVEETVKTAMDCLKYMYDGEVKLTEQNIKYVAEIARLLKLEELVLYCDSFQDLIKKFNKFANEDVRKKPVRYELVVENNGPELREDTSLHITYNTNDSREFSLNCDDDFQSYMEQSADIGNQRHANQSLEENNFSISRTIKTENDDFNEETDNENCDMVDDDKECQSSENEVSTGDEDSTIPRPKVKLAFAEKSKAKGKVGVHVLKTGDLNDILPDKDVGNASKVEVEMSTGEIFRCTKCPKSYRRQSSLAKHVQLHNGSRPFLCPICSKTFVYKDGLNQHLQTHAEVGNEVCPFCGKTYKHRGSLCKHLNSHNPGRYVCDVCSKQFNRKEYLVSHMKTHGEKQQCGACKALVFHLDKHACKMNRGEPKYECKTCNKKFRHKRYLWEHTKCAHIMGSAYSCEKCYKVFTYRSSLYNHKKFCEVQVQTDVETE